MSKKTLIIIISSIIAVISALVAVLVITNNNIKEGIQSNHTKGGWRHPPRKDAENCSKQWGLPMEKKIVDVNELHVEDVPFVGGKGANLGELTNAGFPVPEAFVLTTVAYDYFVESSKIFDAVNKELEAIDRSSDDSLAQASANIRELFEQYDIPADLKDEIVSVHAKDVAITDGYLPVCIGEVPPGEGAIDLPLVTKLAHGLGDDTPVFVEHLPDHEAYVKAVAAMRSAAEKAGVPVK